MVHRKRDTEKETTYSCAKEEREFLDFVKQARLRHIQKENISPDSYLGDHDIDNIIDTVLDEYKLYDLIKLYDEAER